MPLVVWMASATSLFAQQKSIGYAIINKGDTIGQMQIFQKTSGNDIAYSVASTVTTKMLMKVKVDVQEMAQYHNKKLVVSSSQRFINDKPKANKQTKAYGNYYLIRDDDKEDTLALKEITYDFSMLFFKEPAGVKQVYSNYYQTNLPIQQQESHSYKIDLPEGGSNTYYYNNGLCIRVDLHSSLFTAQMIMKQ